MRHLLHPRWVFVLNTGPIIILLLLLRGEYSVIQSLLKADTRTLWLQFGLCLAGLGAVQAGYAAWCLWRRQALSLGYAGVALVVYVGFLLYYFNQMSILLPADVPRWMVSGELDVYPYTFLMPTLAHAALVLVLRFTPEKRPPSVLEDIGFAFLMLVVTWFLTTVINWLPNWGGIQELAFIILLTAGPIGFFFFIVRAVYVLSLRQGGQRTKYGWVGRVIIGAVLPLLGLALNNGAWLNWGSAGSGVFGNFNSPWFYALALLNGALLALPAPAGKWRRLALFLGRSALLAYTLYFFVVFLPYLPLSLLVIMVFGLGFLMLVPLLLLVVQLQELTQDFETLRAHFSRRVLTGAFVAALLVLPAVITSLYWHDRRVLHQALDYLYNPDYSRQYQLDEAGLASTLAVVRQHKEANRDMFFGASHVPYLATYFNWLVLDNLTLSEDKLSRLERVFLGYPTLTRASFNRAPNEPASVFRLTNLTTRSTYDARQAAWVSWVELELANDTDQNLVEYATTLELPVGCWIQDYYLNIGSRREKGILAEKKAALWTFAQIRNVNRDPGILYYLTGNRVALRVFPFAPREVRRTGIQFVHKEPVALTLNGRRVQLGDSLAAPVLTQPVSTAGREVAYISAAAKQRLPLVQRQPYYHFLLDASAGQQTRKAEYARRVTALLGQRPLSGLPRFSLVNAYSRPVPAQENWLKRYEAEPTAGGLYLGGAIRQVLVKAYQRPEASYPVIVVVSDDVRHAVLDEDFADFSAAYPEQDTFYVLGGNGRLTPHSLRHRSAEALSAASAPAVTASVRAWPDDVRPRAYLPDDVQPSIALNQPGELRLPDSAGVRKSWQDGLLLQGYWLHRTMHPAAAAAFRVPAIQASFRSGIMTPQASYLALENDAQKAALRRKQQETLQAHAALDAGEQEAPPPTEVPIDEWTGLLLIAGGLLAAWQLRQHRIG